MGTEKGGEKNKNGGVKISGQECEGRVYSTLYKFAGPGKGDRRISQPRGQHK